MLDLQATIADVLIKRFTANASRVHELASSMSDDQFWRKPYPYGNSFGHLVRHLTGNLNYYIGTQIAQTGYVRDRPHEFAEASPPSKDETLLQFDSAIAMANRTVESQSPDDWSKAYSAVGTTASNRLEMIVQCAAHMQHHIGQMIYLEYELRQSDPNPQPSS